VNLQSIVKESVFAPSGLYIFFMQMESLQRSEEVFSISANQKDLEKVPRPD